MWEVKLLCWMGERDTRMWQFPLCFALNTPKLSGVYKTMAPTALYIKPWCWPSHRQVAGCRSNNSKYQSWEEKKRKERKKKPSGKEWGTFPFFCPSSHGELSWQYGAPAFVPLPLYSKFWTGINFYGYPYCGIHDEDCALFLAHRQFSRLKPSYEFRFEGLSNFDVSVEEPVQI